MTTVRTTATVFATWNAGLAGAATQVSADPTGIVNLAPSSGVEVEEHELARTSLRDLGFGTSAWRGTGETATRLRLGHPLSHIALEHLMTLWVASSKEGSPCRLERSH